MRVRMSSVTDMCILNRSVFFISMFRGAWVVDVNKLGTHEKVSSQTH